jgi:hypothetical protein
MAGFNRCMGGKDTKLFNPVHIPDQFFVPDFFDRLLEMMEKLQSQKAGMSFIEMVFFNLKAQFFKDAYSADA